MVNLVKAYSAAELIARGAPKLFTTTAADWKAKMVAWFETSEDGPKRKLYPAQVEMVLIDLLAFCFSLLGKEAQAASEQRWLLFATGKHLDVVAANNSTYRLKASSATCQLQFTLDEARSADFAISAGVIAIADEFAFATDEQIAIPAGSLAAEVGATAVSAGPASNGLLPGQINALQSPQEGLSVANLTETTGGAEEESDDSLRFRAANAHDRISKAGGQESYRQQVRAFSPSILAVEVIRPQEGHIWIYPLLDTGLPTSDFMDRLSAFMAPKEKRPQGDNVSFVAPEAVTFTIAGTAKVAGDVTSAKAELEASLEDASQIWSRSLGDYMALSALTCVARSHSVLVDVDLSFVGLAERQLKSHQFAVCTGIDLTVEAIDG